MERRESWRAGRCCRIQLLPTKNLSAAGDAGMVTTNSDEVAERARMLRQHGMRRRYIHDEIGWNTRLDGIPGRDSSVKLKYIEGWNQAAGAVAKRYNALFPGKRAGGDAGLSIRGHRACRTRSPAAGHVWHQYVIRCARRDALREFLSSAQDRLGNLLPGPAAHAGRRSKSLGYDEGSFPEAERAAREVLALPIFPELREDEQQAVVNAIAEFFA